MSRPYNRRLPPTLTEKEVRLLTRPHELPPRPWRYTITPNLVDRLVRIADAAGQMTAAPLWFYRRKDLEARAKAMRILWFVGWSWRSVKAEEVEAVLGGARLLDKREMKHRAHTRRQSLRPRNDLAMSRQASRAPWSRAHAGPSSVRASRP